MQRKPELQRVVSEKIDALLRSAGESARAGDLKESLEQEMLAWDLIPEPKAEWDFYPQSICTNILDDYVAMGDVQNSKKWIARMYEVYDDPKHEDHYVLMTEGSALIKLGLEEDAFAIFDLIYRKFGRRGFEGENLNYFEFYLKERSRRRG